jgi:hypothetical protein
VAVTVVSSFTEVPALTPRRTDTLDQKPALTPLKGERSPVPLGECSGKEKNDASVGNEMPVC